MYLTNIILTSAPWGADYEHGADFEDEYIQFNWFWKRPHLVLRDYNIKNDAFRTFVELDVPIDDVRCYDYLIMWEGDLKNKNYYFISKFEQKNGLTVAYLEIDLLQTYMTSYDIKPSFVVSAHVNRWDSDGLPTANYQDEGIDYGTSILEEVELIKDCPLNFIIVANSPIGILKVKDTGGSGGSGGTDSGGSGGTTPTGGNWEGGVPSKEMYRFLKGFEGYGPYLYNDSGGVPTIGYGITGSEPTEFNQLKANQPCSEELCAKVGWDVLIRKYGKPIVNGVKKLGCNQQRQFDALLDLAYNGGTDLIINSSGNRTLANAIKRNPTDEAYIRPIWEKYFIKDGNGTPQPGLVARRKAECNMYFGKPYEIRTIPKLGSGGNVIGEFKGDGWLP